LAPAALACGQRARILSASVSRAVERYGGMTKAPRPKWLPSSGPGNMKVPPDKWGMTINQWAAFIVSCAICQEKWEELETSDDRKEPGYVNLYQLVDHFVKPWTEGTGNSVALLLNNKRPLKAVLFISHAWGACIHESLVAVLGKALALGIALDVPMWFCAFAQYQPGDLPGDCGPGVAAQLALDPFGQVIASQPPYGVIVVHTSKAELYGRLWCVFEVNEAEIKCVRPTAAFSMRYMTKQFDQMSAEDDIGHLKVKTEKADCWSPDDAAMIKDKVQSQGGFGKLNDKIFKFRCSSFDSTMSMFQEFTEWFSSFKDGDADEGIDFIADAVRNAALWMGLHSLVPLAEAAEDEETCERMLELARTFTEYFGGDGFRIPEGCPPPPRFDISKAGEIPEGDEAIWEALQGGDSVFTTMMIGLLEMGAGGSEIVKIQDKSGFKQAVADQDQEAIKDIFRQWDTDGSGSISKQEMSAVLRKLNPKFTEQQLDIMFESADTNKDGQIDFGEFISWIWAKK